MGTFDGYEPPINIAGTWRSAGKGPDTDLEVRIGYGLMHMDRNADFLHGIQLTHYSMFRVDDGWLVMLKGKGPRKPYIAWIHGPTFKAAMVAATTSIDSGHVDWRVEKPRKEK